MTLWKIIKEDFDTVLTNDPAIDSRFELIFNYPGVWALFWHRISHRLYNRGWKKLARSLMGISSWLTSIDIHPEAVIGRRVFIDHGFGIVIGQTAIIGDDVTIYQGVTLGGVSLVKGKRHPTIANGVVLGAGSKVLGNILVGENCKVGANSVVIRNVPAECTAVGVPARIIDKGRDKSPLSHDKLPDIDSQMFKYLLKRLALLEKVIVTGDKNVLEEEKELDSLYEIFIKTLEK